MKVTIGHSPHQSDRRSGSVISAIVLHADVSASAAQTVAWLQQPKAVAAYHYIVERDGTVTQLVQDARKAWHAGKSQLDGVPDVNQFSLGVCFSNLQDGEEPFDPRALSAGIELVAGLCAKHGIKPSRIASHEAVAMPPGRKQDPGPLFPFEWFVSQVAQRLGPTANPLE